VSPWYGAGALPRPVADLPRSNGGLRGGGFVPCKAETKGHDGCLLPRRYWRGYVRSQRNHYADAEPATWPTVRAVPIKGVSQ